MTTDPRASGTDSSQPAASDSRATDPAAADLTPVEKTEAQWLEELGPERYHILREKGTERPFSGEYCDLEDRGVYSCGACGLELFRSDQKFHSGCGWPSFFAEMAGGRVKRTEDVSHGMRRVEITCARCDGHLGHVFPDGPKPTGERYCVNSLSVKFRPG